jgi:hypothetical protein
MIGAEIESRLKIGKGDAVGADFRGREDSAGALFEAATLRDTRICPHTVDVDIDHVVSFLRPGNNRS